MKRVDRDKVLAAVSLAGGAKIADADVISSQLELDRDAVAKVISDLARDVQAQGAYTKLDVRGLGRRNLVREVVNAFSSGTTPASAAATAKLPTIAYVLEDVRRRARTLDANELPETQRALREMFTRLEAGFRAMDEEAEDVESEFFVLDDEWKQENAFVARARDPKTNRQKNLVFITTDLLNSMMGDDGVEAAINRVAGILAHELAHPLDDLDSSSMREKWGGFRSSQGREIRADLEAIEILARANFPTDSLYRALQKIDPAEERAKNKVFGALVSGLNTHPERTVRQSAQRLYLTLRNYEVGDSDAIVPLAVEGARVEGEMRAHRPADPHGLAKYRTLDLEQTITELENWASGPKPGRGVEVEGGDNIRLNLMITRLAEKLAPGGDQVSDAMLDRAIAVWMRFIDDPDKFGALFIRWPHLQKRHIDLELPSEIMRGSSLIQEPRFEQKVHAAFAKVFRKKTAAIDKKEREANESERIGIRIDRQRHQQWMLKNLADLCSPDLLRRRPFDRQMEQMVRSVIPPPDTQTMVVRPFDQVPDETKQRAMRIFFERVLPSYPRENQLNLFLGNYLTAWDAHTLEQANRLPDSLPYDLQFLREPKAAGAREDHRALLSMIWKNRGERATLDILSIHANSHPWELAFKEAGLSREEGIAELRRSIIEYSKSPKYAQLAKDLAARKYTFQQDPFVTRLFYADASLLPALAGDLNPALDDTTRAYTRRVFRGKLISKDLMLNRDALRAELRPRLAKLTSKTKEVDFGKIATDIAKALYGQSEGTSQYKTKLRFPHPNHDIWVEELLRAPKLAFDVKRRVLRDFIIRSDLDLLGLEQSALAWAGNPREPWAMDATLKMLFEEKVFEAPSDLLHSARVMRSASENNANIMLGTMTALEPAVMRELDELERVNEMNADVKYRLGKLVMMLEPYQKLDYRQVANVNNAGVRRIRSRIASLVQKIPMDLALRTDFFDWLTRTGNTQETDALALQLFREDGDHAWQEKFLKLLEEKRVGSPLAQLEMVRELVEPTIARYEGRATMTSARVKEIAELVGQYAPGSSQAKDDYVEKLSWRLGLENEEHLEVLEELKSTNWRAQDPLIVNYASFISANVQDMEWIDRKELIRYLIAKERGDFPAALEAALRRKAEADLEGDAGMNAFERAQKAENRVALARSNLERYTAELTPEGKIPVLEMILQAAVGVENNVEMQREILREFLNFKPNSVEERGFLASMRAMPDYERSVILAYQLSHSGADKSSVRATAEAFKAVGKKVAQMSATFEFFGPELTAELNEVKDNARPMTKLEIRRALREGLREEDYAKIKRVIRVLGSASMKTVVEVELFGGKRLAVGVQFPRSESQVRLQLDRAEKYLREADKDGVAIDAPLIRALLKASRAQLAREMLMTNEAVNIERATEYYARLNREMAKTLGEWRFEVPPLSTDLRATDRVLATEFANGVNFKKMPEGPEKRRVGRAIAEASLRGLFREGWFDPDRHFGNALVDVDAKRIRPLDFGQAEEFSRIRSPWSTDERYRFARLLQAADDGDPAAAVEQALRFHDGAIHISPEAQSELVARTTAAFAKSNTVDKRLTDLARAFAESGIDMDDKLLASGLKGLMTLSKDGYAGADEFRALVRGEVGRLLASKSLRWMQDDPLGTIRSVYGALRGAFFGRE